MFGRGNWAIVGLVKESLEAFSINLADPVRMAAASQLAAAAVARLYGSDAMGINPYTPPAWTRNRNSTLDQQTELARHAIVEQGAATGAEQIAHLPGGNPRRSRLWPHRRSVPDPRRTPLVRALGRLQRVEKCQ